MRRHIVPLVLAAVVMVVVWLLPLLLAGQVYDVYPMLLARNVADAGVFATTDALGRFISPDLLPDLGILTTEDGRLSAYIFAIFSKFIPWTNLLGWNVLAASTMALALMAWWFSVVKLLDCQISWISTILMAFTPLYWRQAVWLDNYNFAILFLFLSFAAFVYLQKRSQVIAIIASGILFGLSVASKDTFLIFVPWLIVAYAWIYRLQWKKAALGIVLFAVCSGTVYLLPYMGDIREQGYPTNHNLALFWPGATDVREGFYLHLYPDPYTYHFDRQDFEANLVEKYDSAGFLEKLRTQKIFINFNVGDPGIPTKLLNGVWLFVGSIPALFQQQTFGGAALWLFILPGFVVLWKRQKRIIILMGGLIISSEFIMRFVLHYSRDHSMDYGWVFVLFAAVGVYEVAKTVSGIFPSLHFSKILTFIVIVLVAHLLQANRVVFANNYRNSPVPHMLALATSVQELPEASVIAVGIGSTRAEQLAQLSGRTVVPFSEVTVEKMLSEKKLQEVFDQYEVTNVFGYSDALIDGIKRQFLSVQIIPPPLTVEIEPMGAKMNFFLHLFR